MTCIDNSSKKIFANNAFQKWESILYLVQTSDSQLGEVPVSADNGLCGSFSER